MAYKDTIVFPPDGKIDVDSEVRRVKKGDIVDAFNCRWGVRNDGSVFAIENVKGNELIAINLPIGNNKAIGYCNDFPNNRVIFFLFNDQNNHCILQVDMIRKEVSPIVWSLPTLNFSDGYIMNAHVVAGNLLIYLNTNGELQNLLIDKAIKTTYNTYGSGIGYWIIEDDFVIVP
jgi:hypothetical protein